MAFFNLGLQTKLINHFSPAMQSQIFYQYPHGVPFDIGVFQDSRLFSLRCDLDS